MITGSRLNTDVAQPPKRTTSPGEEELQAVCHIRLTGELTRKKSQINVNLEMGFWTLYLPNEYDVSACNWCVNGKSFQITGTSFINWTTSWHPHVCMPITCGQTGAWTPNQNIISGVSLWYNSSSSSILLVPIVGTLFISNSSPLGPVDSHLEGPPAKSSITAK